MSPTSTYRERLTPSLWVLLVSLLAVPMIALVFLHQNATLGLALGLAVGFAILVMLVLLAPVIEVRDGELHTGRAHIPVRWLDSPEALTGEAAKLARGQQLNARSWYVIRGGIDGLATFRVNDPDDPTPKWVVSSRTPDRLVAAVKQEQLTQRTPDK